MKGSVRLFTIDQQIDRSTFWSDVVILVGIGVVLYVGVELARQGSASLGGTPVSLSPRELPIYTLLSLKRMFLAYVISFLFTLFYGYAAAYHRTAERFLMPVLDVLQSVPILSFLPVVLLSLSAILPQETAVELASVILIVTSQVWNLTFSWYQSLITVPKDLHEAGTIFLFNPLLRFKVIEMPFAAISLIWNSMMSWAGGWFFLMAAEIFTVGQKNFRLPGLGAYLSEAAGRGDLKAVLWGVATLVLVIVVLDQFVWRPLLVWSDRFKLEMVESEGALSSWFYDVLVDSRLLRWLLEKTVHPVSEGLDSLFSLLFRERTESRRTSPLSRIGYVLLGIFCGAALVYGTWRAGSLLWIVSGRQWARIAVGLGATLLRVLAALIVAFAWTVPLGVAIGTNRKLAAILQPLVQIAASVPATALFPVFLLFLLHVPAGLNLAAILLMLMGTQWYLLFNIIAGAAVIPQDLKYTATLLKIRGWERWKTLVLPALFPYMITGGIAAGGGAWNASIIAEHVHFGGHTFQTVGIGSLIAEATAAGDFSLLLASTVSMIVAVVLINRLWWRRLYRLAEERYRME